MLVVVMATLVLLLTPCPDGPTPIRRQKAVRHRVRVEWLVNRPTSLTRMGLLSVTPSAHWIHGAKVCE